MSELSDKVTRCDDVFQLILEEMKALRAQKNHDYANSFMRTYDKYGFVGVAMDLGRKMERIDVMAEGGRLKVSDETIDQTLMDLSLMAINALIWRRCSSKVR